MNTFFLGLSSEEQGKYISLQEEINNPGDFETPKWTTSERYWRAFTDFTAHFTKFDDVQDLQQTALASFIDSF